MNDLDIFVSKQVNKIRIDKKINVDKISEYLEVSSEFIRSVFSFNKKFNVEHLYLLTFILECQMDDFFPNINNFNKAIGYERLYNYEKFSNELKDKVKKSRKNKKKEMK